MQAAVITHNYLGLQLELVIKSPNLTNVANISIKFSQVQFYFLQKAMEEKRAIIKK
jgi:hypothetical protein